MKLPVLALLALVVVLPASNDAAFAKGIEGEQAPNWDITEWFNLPDGKEKLEISDFRGRVLMLYNYQSW